MDEGGEDKDEVVTCFGCFFFFFSIAILRARVSGRERVSDTVNGEW